MRRTRQRIGARILKNRLLLNEKFNAAQRAFIVDADSLRKQSSGLNGWAIDIFFAATNCGLAIISFRPDLVRQPTVNLIWFGVLVFYALCAVTGPMLICEAIRISNFSKGKTDSEIREEATGLIWLQGRTAIGTAERFLSKINLIAFAAGLAATGHFFWCALLLFFYMFIFVGIVVTRHETGKLVMLIDLDKK